MFYCCYLFLFYFSPLFIHFLCLSSVLPGFKAYATLHSLFSVIPSSFVSIVYRFNVGYHTYIYISVHCIYTFHLMSPDWMLLFVVVGRWLTVEDGGHRIQKARKRKEKKQNKTRNKGRNVQDGERCRESWWRIQHGLLRPLPSSSNNGSSSRGSKATETNKTPVSLSLSFPLSVDYK